jgi:hypothetical protein
MRDTFGSLAEARIALARQALAGHPGSPDLLFALAEALAEQGEYDEYARVFRQAYLLNPSSRPKIQFPLSPAETAALHAAGQALIARGVSYSPVLAATAFACCLLGDTASAARLVDYDRFFRCIPNVVPPEFTGADFYQQLAAEIKTDLIFYTESGTRAIRQAWRNNFIVESTQPACRAIVAEIIRQVDRYIAALPADDDHPFIVTRPDKYEIGAWAVLSHGEGHHIPHIHPKAWMSGVYYVVRPEISRAPGGGRGWLRVGPPHGLEATQSGWQQRLVEPEPGNLVLMPGYFYHETQAMGVDQERICIAFDVMPLELAGASQGSGDY